MKVFPYYISYIVRDPIIWILAVAHGHPGRTTDSYRFDVMGQTAL
jgi:hypothetical protein